MQYTFSLLTDRGLEREQNEDNCTLALTPATTDASPLEWHTSSASETVYKPLTAPGVLALVADGMGGRNAGEVASQMLIDSLQQQCTREALAAVPSEEGAEGQFLSHVIAQAHDTLMQHLENHPENLGMATTLITAWLRDDKLHLAWCGDCRAYLYTPKQGLRLLSHDHSYVQQLVDEKKITPEEAFDHPDSNLVTRGIGDVDVDTEAETLTLPLVHNSLLLLCSDGISGYLRDQEISRILSRHFTAPLPNCTQALLDAAYAAGGGDNITTILLSLIPDTATSPSLPLLSRLKSLLGL